MSIRSIRIITRLLPLLIGLAVYLPLTADAGESLRITVAGGAVRGADSVVGEAIGVMVRREFPDTAYTYEPGNVAGNLVRLAAGTHAYATSGPAEIAAARAGQPPFPSPVDVSGFRVIARVADGVLLYFVARRDFLDEYGVTTLADLNRPEVTVRISVGRTGTPSVRLQALHHLAAAGVTRESIEARGGTVYDYAMPEAVDLLRNGRLDIAFTGGHFPEARILELSRAIAIDFIPIGDEAAIRRVAEETGAETGVIPALTYDFLEADYPTTAMSLYLLAGPAADDDSVAKIARALHRQFGYLAHVHPMYDRTGPEMLVRTGKLPLHPAAAGYYRQAGLLPSAAH